MPEFVLDMGSPEGARAFNALDSFTQGYLEAAFFTSTGNAEDDDLESASVAELAPEAIARAVKDCSEFQADNAALLARAYDCPDYSPEQAGRDFWFTRNGHGVGFWSREQLATPHSADGRYTLAYLLGERARRAVSCYMYRGDDGQIYFS